MKGLVAQIGILSMLVALASCGSSARLGKPKSFQQTPAGWSTILLRDGLTYDQAFGEVLDVCAKRFELDMISKDGAYARTKWNYTWNKKGEYTEKYRTRVIFKFSADRSKVDIKAEAEYGGDGQWIQGFDTELLSTMKQDISGAVGRVVM